MTGRERILNAIEFKESDRTPMDLGGMLSTSISCFLYPRLVEALGLPPRPTRVFDTGQMLALPDLNVLDALGCDAVTVLGDVTNAFEQPEKWAPYDFNGRLDALVRNPAAFEVLDDGTILQNGGASRMPPTSHVFESAHGGQPISFSAETPKPDLAQLERDLEASRMKDEEIEAIAAVCKRVRESTDRAVFFNGPGAGIGIGSFGGMAVFPILCMTEPDFVLELHELVTSHACEQIAAVLDAVAPFIDIYMCCSDDWGTQSHTIAPPQVYRDLFMPFYRQVTDTIHESAPNVKAFLHSCGAIFDILEDVIDTGFDILNPVQWTAGGHSYMEWKDVCRNRITLWGGGVNAQATLPLGTPDNVRREVAEVVACMRQDSGFVFTAIHNILAEVAPENVIAMYQAAAEVH